MKTVCLNMIVKDERETIARCIASVKQHIHSWIVVDTGSTDGTQKLIRELLGDLPGELHERPWVDYAHNRNEALLLARGKSDYLLFIDADEELICLNESCFPELGHDCYLVEHRQNDYCFVRTLLIANQRGWSWQGAVHEMLVHENPPSLHKGKLSGFYKFCHARDALLSIPKMLRDAEILEREHRLQPKNPRTVFYLAQNYFQGREYAKAFHYYEKRTTMGGWHEEIYWSHLRRALIQDQYLMASPEIFVPLYYAAYQYNPSRIEALYYLACHYAKQNQYHAAYDLLKIALMTPKPEDAALVEQWMYDWSIRFLLISCATPIGRSAEARRLAEELLEESHLPPPQRKALEEFYLKLRI